jgi:hypothetical protein
MTTTEDMAAAREVQACYQAILGIDSIRKSLNRLSVTLVDIGERVATHGTGIDEVEGLSRLAWRHYDRPGGHSYRRRVREV